MNLSILDKILLIIKYFISSFLGIELFLVVLLLFVFLLLNIKRNNNLVKIIIPIILGSILLFISGGFHSYVIASIKYFIKKIMLYYYFPSVFLYYIIIVFITLIFIFTILNGKMRRVKRIVNYSFFSIIYLLFLGFFSNVINNKIELLLDRSIYIDDLSLAFIQMSNLIVFIWVVFTLFYYLYYYLKRKFD